MFTKEIKKEICIRRFENFQSIRKISTDLNLPRYKVTNFIRQCAIVISDLTLNGDDVINNLDTIIEYTEDKKGEKISSMNYNNDILEKAKLIIEGKLNQSIDFKLFKNLINNGLINVKLYGNKKSFVKKQLGLSSLLNVYEYEEVINNIMSIDSDSSHNKVLDILFEHVTSKLDGKVYYDESSPESIYIYIKSGESLSKLFSNKKVSKNTITTNRYLYIKNNHKNMIDDLYNENVIKTHSDFIKKYGNVNNLKIFESDNAKVPVSWRSTIYNSILLTLENLSVKEISLKCNLSYPTVRKAIYGDLGIKYETINKLEKGLNLELYR